MPIDTNERILIDAGLSEEQAAVYSALLDKGPQKASNLASWTGIKRSLIYKILEQLENMGFVDKKGGAGAVAVFSPNHPSLLLSSFEQKEKQLAMTKELLTSELGQLTSKFNLLSGKPNVQFFEGEEGIKTVLWDTLTSKEAIYTFTDIEAIMKYIPEINKEYSDAREKKNIKKRGLLLDSPEARKIIEEYHTEVTDSRFISRLISEFATIMQIYDGKISYITLKENSMIGIIVEDPAIYAMHRSLFEYTWEITPPSSQEQPQDQSLVQ